MQSQAEIKSTTRRQALRSIGLLGGAFVLTRTLAACGFDGAGAGAGAGAREATASSEDGLVACDPPIISSNHGHALSVPAEDIAAGEEKTYSIKGGSTHDHLVTITAEHFAQLAAGGAITVMSTSGGMHKHNVTVTCSTVTKPGGDGGVGVGEGGGDPDASTSLDGTAPATCVDGAKASSISSNHGHALVVSAADVAAGAPKTYSIKGTSSHPHDVSLSSADFAQLRSGGSVTVLSSSVGGHTHSVVVSCA